MSVIKYRNPDPNFRTFTTAISSFVVESTTITVNDASGVGINQLVDHPEVDDAVTVASVNRQTRQVTLSEKVTINTTSSITFVSEYSNDVPLTAVEIDSNFKNLNSTKIESDGSVPIDGDFTVTGLLSANTINTSVINITSATLGDDTTNQTDDQQSLDSLIGVPGSFSEVPSTGQNRVTSRVKIDDETLRSNFTTDSVIRIYGAGSSTSNFFISRPDAFGIEREGFQEGNDSDPYVAYRFALWNFITGEFSEASVVNKINLSLITGDDIWSAFNRDNFIRITGISSGLSENQGILIYRKTSLYESDGYRLIDVLGPKEIALDSYIDYFNFDYNSWSGKRVEDNSYTAEGLVHFPLNPPESAKRGWVDRTIQSIEDQEDGSFILDLDSDLITNNNETVPTCEIAHNDTPPIQNAIDSNRSVGFVIGRNFLLLSFRSQKSLVLNSKRYVCSRLDVPNNFSLGGSPGITEVRKLPWSGAEFENKTQSLIRCKSDNPKNVVLNGISFQGDILNQFQFTEGVNNQQSNYAIDFRRESEECRMINCDVENVIGGGVYATDATDFEIFNCSIQNSGRSDRYDYSPLIADNGTDLFVQSSKFRNFSSFIDVSVTNKGSIVNNIVENCGSGILVYGSKFFISNPNVLIGPAGEYLPIADNLNSEYDLANIQLQDIYSDFFSPVFRYQENGENFNLDANNGNVIYNTYLLKKNSETGIESFWGINKQQINLVNVENTESDEGVFQFRIPKLEVQSILVDGQPNSFSTLSAEEPEHIGIVWTASLERETPAGSIDTTFAGEWSPNTQPSDYYQITVLNPIGLSIGQEVTFTNHTDWSSGGIERGVIRSIDSISGSSDERLVTIEFEGALTTNDGIGGTINIIERFVMAKGRIL